MKFFSLQAHNLCHISRQTTRKREIWDIASVRRVYPLEETRNPNLAWLQLCMPSATFTFQNLLSFWAICSVWELRDWLFDHLISCNWNLKVSRGWGLSSSSKMRVYYSENSLLHLSSPPGPALLSDYWSFLSRLFCVEQKQNLQTET